MRIKQIIQILIIRWALKKVSFILGEQPNISYGGLENLGIEDFEYLPKYKQYRIDIWALNNK